VGILSLLYDLLKKKSTKKYAKITGKILAVGGSKSKSHIKEAGGIDILRQCRNKTGVISKNLKKIILKGNYLLDNSAF